MEYWNIYLQRFDLQAFINRDTWTSFHFSMICLLKMWVFTTESHGFRLGSSSVSPRLSLPSVTMGIGSSVDLSVPPGGSTIILMDPQETVEMEMGPKMLKR